MNRQAVPSILLSIATVCFFAVILYHRDPQGRRTVAGERVTSGDTPPIEESTPGPKPAGGPSLAPNPPATAVTPHTPVTAGPASGSRPRVAAATFPGTRNLPAGRGR